MDLPNAVEFVIKEIMKAGGQAYLVGGALRDYMLGKSVLDYDIASSFPPEQIEKIFSNKKTWPSGKRFGTITVKVQDTIVEITTFRSEATYTDNRHPDQVTFISDIYQDLARRDFTINAMAFNPYSSDGLVDPFGGREDLEKKIIRAVGNPIQRFTEDPLRIMRGVRFSAQLNFGVQEETKHAMKICCSMLQSVSTERLRSELDNLLLSPIPDKGLLLMRKTGILAFLLDIEEKEYPIADHYRVIRDMGPSLVYRLSTLFSIIYPEALSDDRLDWVKNKLVQLRYDKKTILHILKMLQGYYEISHMDITPFTIRKLLGNMGIQDAKQCFKWFEKMHQFLGHPSAYQRMQIGEKIFSDIIRQNDPVFFHQLAINGEDVLQAGIGLQDPGMVGDALDLAYKWVLEEPKRNQAAYLIARLKEQYS